MRRLYLTGCGLLLALLFARTSAIGIPPPGSSVIFATGFETTEGYSDQNTLTGQNGWVSDAIGGNGLLTNFFEGLGQQAFVGFALPAPGTNGSVSVWKPVNFTPNTNSGPVVKFSVLMAIIASNTTNRDEFRWTVYNSAGVRLFSLDFDTAVYQVFYSLDNTQGFLPTDTVFSDLSLSQLDIYMNFRRNLWTAVLNNMVVVNSQPITTAGSLLDFGDVDAQWVIARPGQPGDNYMLFDEYVITEEATPSIPPVLELLTIQSGNRAPVRLYGEPRVDYVIDGSYDLAGWVGLLTNQAPDGIIDLLDAAGPTAQRRFYRARQLSP